MKRSRMVFLFILILGLWQGAGPRSVQACSCTPPPEPRDALDQAGSVFSGKVVSVTAEESSTGIMQQAVSFDVMSSWKNTARKQIVVRTATDSAACGFAFEVGERYLVYASGDGPTNLATSLCSRTKLLRVAAEDVAKLGPGRQPVTEAALQPTTQPITQPTVQPATPKTVQPSFIPYVIPIVTVVLILLMLYLVMFRGKKT